MSSVVGLAPDPVLVRHRTKASWLGIASTAVLAALACGGVASAQDASGDQVEAIVVTGSRIKSPDATSVSPVSTVGDKEISRRGVVRVEDLINTLPQAFADQGSGNRGGTVGASGTATINLRNLGNQRTLVLIDGRRLMQGDPARSAAQAADINNIPAALIQRIDVVTGGASAVYGSDALAGVVNFMLKRDFEGVQLDVQGGLYMHENRNSIASVAKAAGQAPAVGRGLDGGQQSYSITAGKNFGDGRGNVTGFFSYKKIDGVGTKDRDFSTCNLSATATGYACSLSSATYPVQFQLTNPTTGATRGSYALEGNTLRTYRSTDGFNNGNTYDLQSPDKRYNADLFGRYRISDKVEAYGELMYMHDEADIKLSPTAVFTVSEKINCNNPLMSAQEKNLICTSVGLTDAQSANVIVSQRNALGGSRHDYSDHTSYRGVAGLRGDLTSHWRYDVYAQYGRTDYSSRLTGDYSLAKFAKALRAVTDSSGKIVCESVVNGTDPSCVPINLFQADGITSAALNYVQNVVYRKGYTEESILSGALTGDLGLTSPLASYPIGVAIGAEYRKEKISFQPDSYYSSRDVAGNSGGEFPIAGSFDVKEVYGEIRVPLVENKPLFKSLSAEGGFRYSDYSTAGDTWAYKGGGEWTPISDIRLRASYQRAVRAPNLVELFGPQRVVTAAISDPCEGTTPKATAAQCALSGVTATQYGSIAPAAGQQSGAMVGGNPNLDPETSNTKSFGVQFTPRFVQGLSISIDYFDIDVKKLITTVPASIELNQCLNAGIACDLIKRNAATGSLVTSGYVITTSVNAGYLKTKGLDVAVSYSHGLPDLFGKDMGRVGLNFAGTKTDKYEVQILPGLAPYSCDGHFGVTCGQPIPEWRHRLVADWTSRGGVNLSATWRYIGGTKNDKSSSSIYLTGTYQPYDLKMPSVSYVDFAASANVTEKVTLRVGVNNALDKDPPLTASTGGQTSNGAFFAGMYDSLGRYMFVGATARF
ncbi:TonB-dependent receptor domain-containing protein [Caulobacter segnis]|uniref:TonB-dependent receptor domain-containing protein n=1 Tax=Caulobacter segnis TaxID=88688 RepID=UPI001CBCB30E|nr:TonB-dependent receptor [Caulobacter segnis]UAL08671.1 TonB-dependent receptor [Caulobacter segnis]